MPIYDNIMWFVLSIALCGFDVIEWPLFGLVSNLPEGKYLPKIFMDSFYHQFCYQKNLCGEFTMKLP